MALFTLGVSPTTRSFLFSSFRLEIDGKDSVWTRDQRVRIQHVDTGAYLHSHDKKYSRIAGGQQEVRHICFILNSLMFGLSKWLLIFV